MQKPDTQETIKSLRTFDLNIEEKTYTDGYNSKRLEDKKVERNDPGMAFADKVKINENVSNRYEEPVDKHYQENKTESTVKFDTMRYKDNAKSDIYNEILADIYDKRRMNSVGVKVDLKEENSSVSDYSWSSHTSKGLAIKEPKYTEPKEESSRTKPLEVGKNKKTPKNNPAGKIAKKDNKENVGRQKSLVSTKSTHTLDRKSSCRRQPCKTAIMPKTRGTLKRGDNSNTMKKQDLWKTKYESLKNKYMKLYSEYNELAENYRLSEQSRKLLQKRIKEQENRSGTSCIETPILSVKKKPYKHK